MTFRALVALLLGQLAAVALSDSDCYRGHTGRNSGASCAFEARNWCNWTNVGGDKLDWDLNEGWWFRNREEIFVETFGKLLGDNAYLVGPRMCETKGIDLCLRFRYKLDRSHGGKLSLFVCPQWLKETCTRTAVWYTTNWADGEWQQISIPFKSTGHFQMIFEGKKYEDKGVVDADIYLDDIHYTNKSCEVDQSAENTTPKAADTTESTEGTATTHVVRYSSSESDSDSDWLVPTTTGSYEQVERRYEGQDELTDHTSEVGIAREGDMVEIIILMVVPVLVVLLIVTTLVVVIVIRKRRRPTNSNEETNGGVKYDRSESLVVVSNELYSLTGADNGDLHNDDHDHENHEPTPPRTRTTTADVAADPSPHNSDYYSIICDNKLSCPDKGDSPLSESAEFPGLSEPARVCPDRSASKTSPSKSDVLENEYSDMPGRPESAEQVYHNLP